MTTLQQLTDGIERFFPIYYQEAIEGFDQILFELIQAEQVHLVGDYYKEPGRLFPGTKHIGGILEISSQELRALREETDDEIRYNLIRTKFEVMSQAVLETLEGMKDVIGVGPYLLPQDPWVRTNSLGYRLCFLSMVIFDIPNNLIITKPSSSSSAITLTLDK